jgi:hypothetical protein
VVKRWQWHYLSEAKPETLLIPIDLSFPFHGGGALRYTVPKWLLFFKLMWGVVFTACVVFSFLFFFKAECSHYWALPTHYIKAVCNHALVTIERMVSPLDFIPEFYEFWTAHPRDRSFVPEQMRSPHSSLDSPSAT